MLKFLKNILKKEVKQITLEDVRPWLLQEIKNSTFTQDLQNYLNRLKEIKPEILEKINILEAAAVTEKDRKQVEQKVRNIVLGHKEKYVREVRQFTERLAGLDKQPTCLADLQEMFNLHLSIRESMDHLATSTAKSYQASQHLFFNLVEPVFNLLGEINLMMKNIDQQSSIMGHFTDLDQAVTTYENTITKEDNLKEEVTQLVKTIGALVEQRETAQKQFQDFLSQPKYEEYLQIKKTMEDIEAQIKEQKHLIFTFFAKLSKPLRKYERVALESKLISHYLEDPVAAFSEDKQMQIQGQLTTMIASLPTMGFDGKQKENFIKWIEQNNLLEISGEIARLTTDQAAIVLPEQVQENKERLGRRVADLSKKTESANRNLEELQYKLQSINLNQLKLEIKEKMEKFNVILEA